MVELESVTTFWLEWQARAMLIALFVLLISASFNWRSPLWRHWMLVVGSALLVLLPIIMLALPTLEITILPGKIQLSSFAPWVEFEASSVAATDNSQVAAWRVAFMLLSLLVSMILMLRYAVAWRAQKTILDRALEPDAKLRRLFEECVQEVGIRTTSAKLRIDPKNSTPCTVGWLVPKVLLSGECCQQDRASLRIILIHELYHIKRNDWLWQQLTNILVFINPLNPLAWRMRVLTRMLAEESVDKSVLSHDIPPMEYADTLLRQLLAVRGFFAEVAVQMHRRNDISERVESLIAEPYSWPDFGTKQRWPLALLMSLCALPMMVVVLVQAPSKYVDHTDYSTANVLDLQVDPVISKDLDISNPTYQPIVRIQNPVRQPSKFSEFSPPEPDTRSASTAENYVDAALLDRLSLTIPIEPKPRLLVEPSYPARALQEGWEARVEVAFDLNDNGDVMNPRVLNPGGWKARYFERAALRAIQSSQYDLRPTNREIFIQKDLTQTYVFQIADSPEAIRAGQMVEKPP